MAAPTKLSDRIDFSPFMRIIVPLIAGIVTAQWVEAPQWFVFSAAAAVYAAAWALCKSEAGWWYLTAAILMTGILLAKQTAVKEELPRGERLLIVAEIDETPYTQGRWQRTTAQTGYFRPYDFRSGTASPADNWQKVSEKIQLYIDTCYRIAAGEQIVFRGYLNPIDTTGSSYGRLMRSRSMSARSYLVPGALVARMTPEGHRPSYWAGQIQHGAVERIMRLRLDEQDKNMVATLVAGERRGMDRGLREAYSLTGVAHILSVSGLHMGFVLIIINLLLGWIVFFRRGHLVKNVLVILAMWCYAVVAGLSPPVIRAALMMSFAQLAFTTSQKGNGYNIVLGAATLMLAINPNYLWDVSFQLSFAAVLSILFFYPRLYRLRKYLGKTPGWIVSSFALGIAAQIGTLPLVAYSFGNIPLVALVVNPVVIFTSFIVIAAGLLWLLLPLGILNPVCSAVIKTVLRVQNGVVEWAATTPVAAVRDVDIGGGTVLVLYGLLAIAALWIKLREEKRAQQPGLSRYE